MVTGNNPNQLDSVIPSEASKSVGLLEDLAYHFLCEGSAVDVYSCSSSNTSSSDRQDVKIVKKIMRVAPAYMKSVAVNRGEDMLTELRKTFSDRFTLWGSLRHSNIVTLHSVEPSELTLYQDYYPNGDLREYAKKNVSDHNYKDIIEGVLAALVYLHGHNPPIAHGSVNPGKILIAFDGKPRLGEFGLARLAMAFPHLVPSISLDGIVRWMSPEYFVSKPRSESKSDSDFGSDSESDSESEPELDATNLTTQLDMWSFGCTLFEVLTGRLPYQQCKYDAQIIQRIINGDPPGHPEQLLPTMDDASTKTRLGHSQTEIICAMIEQCWLPVEQRSSAQGLMAEIQLKYNSSHTMIPDRLPSGTASASHMMKVTKRGRPFLKDSLDLFATLIVSLDLVTHKQFFKSFPYSFTADEAAQKLASLKFSRSNRGPDPRDPSRIVTTTTTTTFSMTREMAKALSQHFMDARLIENAADRASNVFKERGIYVVTPKGLHVLERFIIKNGVNGDNFVGVFESQPVCMKLLHLERRPSDDEIIISQPVITALFRRFVGRQPNYMPEAAPGQKDPTVEYNELARGMPLIDVRERPPQMIGKAPLQTFKYCFPAISALKWLCDFTSIVGRDEAAEMAAHFVRFGFIQLVSDKRKTGDSAVIFTVRGAANTPGTATQGEFRCTAKAIYRITDEGQRVARWDQSARSMRNSPNVSQTTLRAGRPATDGRQEGVVVSELSSDHGTGPETLATATEAKIQRRTSLPETLREGSQAGWNERIAKHQSHSERLKRILEGPALRALFREFLRGNFAEENLSFWLEAQDLKGRFTTTSTAAADNRHPAHGSHSPGSRSGPAKSPTPDQQAMEMHHEALAQLTFLIYNTYLAPQSPCELNLDVALRNELYTYVWKVLVDNGFQPTRSGNFSTKEAASFNATQLQNLIQLYERIQLHVFQLMATDHLPKFVKTPGFKDLESWVEDIEIAENDTIASVESMSISGPATPPSFESGNVEEVGRAYLTFSATAGEKAALKLLGQGIAHDAPQHDKSP